MGKTPFTPLLSTKQLKLVAGNLCKIQIYRANNFARLKVGAVVFWLNLV